jgi:hypothetical protein
MYRLVVVTVAAGASTLIIGLRLGRCIAATLNSLESVQIPVLGAMVVVVQLPEISLD